MISDKNEVSGCILGEEDLPKLAFPEML